MVEKRGRKGVTDLEVLHLDPNTGRPEPPEDVGGREAELWRSIVNSMPRNWFGPETWPLLKGFCLHAYAAELLGARYRAALQDAKADISVLQSQYSAETGAMGRLATKLRIAKLQRTKREYVDEAAIRNAPRARMWEEDVA
jgi:hypothetical protein